ncbi:autotransporter domain-containing protein [Pseudomonas sp. CAU 1711]|uniref:autotransporter outer membrane beta-barrel domain-containing protein n=1 Tax=Pseudomonas sp. CAU 1711 TaxID=3140356 RepID=UPI0032605749
MGRGTLLAGGLWLLCATAEAVVFSGTDSAGSGSIDNTGGTLIFNDQSTAGSTSINNDVAGLVQFNDQSTAGQASITNIDDSVTEFHDQSTAGTASLVNQLDGSVEFHGNSSAGNASIVNENGGSTLFYDNSTAGNARLVANAGGFVQFFGAGAVSAGSIAGAGDFYLGTVLLSVGSNNLSTLMAGTLHGAGASGLVKVGTGTLSLSGDSSDYFDGSIRVEAGLIRFSSADSLGSNLSLITLDGGGLQWAAGNTDDISDRLQALGAGGGRLDTNGNDVTLASALSGVGGLTKAGGGTLLLNAVNGYSGTTRLENGTLRQGLAGGLVGGGAYVIDGGVLDLNGFDLTMASLSGSGGSLSLGTAQLTVNQASDSSFAGAIGGSGGLVKSGGGTLTLTGSSGYTGATLVNGGTLLVNGSLVSPVQVASGGTLGGTGSVGVVVVDGGGILAPGNSIGTLTVNGNLAFNGNSVYQVEVDPAGNSDRIVVTGQASLAGTVQVLAGQGSYALGTTYSILSSGSPLLGQFDAVTSNLAFLDPSLSYSSNEVFLTLLRNDVTLVSLAQTPNQRAFAQGASGLPASNEVARTLFNLAFEQVPATYDRLSGDAHASFSTALILDDLGLPWVPLEQLDANLSDPQRALPFWVQVQTGHQRTRDDGNAGLVVADQDGVLMGGDWALPGGWRMGMAFGYGDQQLEVGSRSADGEAGSYRSALYAGNQMPVPGGKLKVALGASYSRHQVDGRRSLQLADGAQRLLSGYDVGIAQGFGELALRLGDDQQSYLEPFARLVSLDQRAEGFRERGGSAALNASSQANQLLSSTIGSRGQHKTQLLGRELVLNGSLALRHLQGDLQPQLELRLDEGEPYRVLGTELPDNSLLLDLRAEYAIAPGIGLDLRYQGMSGSGSESNALAASLRWRF